MKGNPALKSIDLALDTAKVHVAVVSRGYARSKYCLNELVAMLRSGKPVVPVFYDVDPVDLRWVENGPFAEAFEEHKVKGRTAKKVRKWREALDALAQITGFRLADYRSDEAKLKREVVNQVACLMPSNDPVEVEKCRVGLEGPTKACVQILENMDHARVGILGLVGMGGVGKTTLAREIYNHYVAKKKFRYMTFLEVSKHILSSSNVEIRPTKTRKLREQVLWDLLRVQGNTSNYSSWLQNVSSLGPVFIVMDDVHKLDQFEELIPSASLLHPGSRILITSRDRSILKCISGSAEVESSHSYDVSMLNWDESNMLFNWYAFRANEASKDYNDVAKDVVKACGGLPLALKVIGSSLFDKKSVEERETIWLEAVNTLRQSMDVMGVLRWSYNNLSDSEKCMF
ncbi:hypothetical protein M758_12G088900 [Ceratodon purpureus]|nr:hypothetical protein M758_12G088900 [Ceratodon purpureus]